MLGRGREGEPRGRLHSGRGWRGVCGLVMTILLVGNVSLFGGWFVECSRGIVREVKARSGKSQEERGRREGIVLKVKVENRKEDTHTHREKQDEREIVCKCVC